MNKHFEALELNIVLDMLAAEASCPDAAEKAKSITPVLIWRMRKDCFAKRRMRFRCLRVSVLRPSPDSEM